MNEDLKAMLAKLGPEQQAKVLEFAEVMLKYDVAPRDVIFYINRYTFEVSEQLPDHDLQAIVPCFAYDDDDLFKPLIDANGQLVTRAPRWFVEITSRQQQTR
ncbi:MAG: hypothetical protein L0154_08355 [Chloroflexi bacterium]|nr:hypothetical protein [Chloroflexota bacterium]